MDSSTSSMVQGGDPCQDSTQASLPPAPRPSGTREPIRLWNLLTDEQRQQTLETLSGIVVRQLDAPRDELEVRDEPS